MRVLYHDLEHRKLCEGLHGYRNTNLLGHEEHNFDLEDSKGRYIKDPLKNTHKVYTYRRKSDFKRPLECIFRILEEVAHEEKGSNACASEEDLFTEKLDNLLEEEEILEEYADKIRENLDIKLHTLLSGIVDHLNSIHPHPIQDTNTVINWRRFISILRENKLVDNIIVNRAEKRLRKIYGEHKHTGNQFVIEIKKKKFREGISNSKI